MAQRTRRRRRSWSRILLLAVFAAAALYAAYFCLFRPPEVPAEETVPAEDADEPAGEETPQEDPEALARAAHLERKDYFYTILLSGSDDGNGNSDTNILLGVDAENGRIHGVSIPRDTKAVWDGKNHKINAAFGSGGVEKLADVVGEQLGIPVDFTVAVDLTGFEALVNASKEMQRLLMAVSGWDAVETYMYLSVAGDVEINQGCKPCEVQLSLRLGIPKLAEFPALLPSPGQSR